MVTRNAVLRNQAHQEGVLSANKKFSIRGWRRDGDRGNAVLRIRLTRKVLLLHTRCSV